MERKRLHQLLVVLGFAITIVFGYLAVRDAHLSEVWDGVKEMNAWWLLPAFGLLALCVLLRTVRWQALFAPQTRPPFPIVLRALLAAYVVNNLLPLRPGEVLRVVILKRQAGTSAAEAGATVVVERVYDVFALLLLLFVATPLLPEVTWLTAAGIFAAVVSVGLGTVIVVVAVWGDRPLIWAIRPLARFSPVTEARLEQIARNAVAGMAGLRHLGIATIAFFWTILSWLVLALSNAALLAGFDTGLDARDTLLAGLLVVVATNLAMVLPSSPAALGVFEAATVVALKAFGVDDSLALSYALVLHALNLFPYLACAPFVLPGSLRRVSATTLDEAR